MRSLPLLFHVVTGSLPSGRQSQGKREITEHEFAVSGRPLRIIPRVQPVPPPTSWPAPTPSSRRTKRENRGRGLLTSFRLFVLGAPALRREARFHKMRRGLAERLALARGVVIFADYLADLIVLDLLSDIAATPSVMAIPAALAGLCVGVVVADGATGVAAWLSAKYAPRGLFACLPDIPEPTGPPRHFRCADAPLLAEPDVFYQLLNSCFLTTPLLSVAVSWSASISGPAAIFGQGIAVASLALTALAPLLRPAPARPDAPLIAFLRYARFLKSHPDSGWAQICGITDPILALVLPKIDFLVKWTRDKSRR